MKALLLLVLFARLVATAPSATGSAIPPRSGLGPIPASVNAMGAPRATGVVVVCVGKALLGPFGL